MFETIAKYAGKKYKKQTNKQKGAEKKRGMDPKTNSHIDSATNKLAKQKHILFLMV